MPQRKLTLGLLWLATAALLALLVLLLALRGSVAVDAALALNLLLLPLPPLALALLSRRRADAPAGDAQMRFLAQLSHEMRTPMNAVMGMTQLALQTPLNAEQRRLLHCADAASRALLDLVEDAIDAARIEAGRLDIAQAPLRIEDVVAQAVERLRLRHAQPGVGLVCDWADGALLGERGALLGDAARLRQVLLQLLSLACRALSSGEVLLRLEAGPAGADGRLPLTLRVQTRGEGGEQLADGFAEAGAGLGPGLTRRLVELMGGRLQAQREPGQGRVDVTLSLPRDPTAAAAPLLPSCRLLLAEAPAGSRLALATLLRQLGLGDGVVVAADAETTWSALTTARDRGRAFDWLLLDWQLPGLAGAELLARLRREHPALRVAVLGPPAAPDEPAAARAFGARALLQRPPLPAELRRLLGDAAPQERRSDGQALAGLRVLLVEDHPVNQEIARRLLGSRGAQVDVAANGQLGLERLQAAGPGAYDLVLMDLQMPVLDGLAATRRLRALPGFATLPVLAMTAHALPEEREQCLAAGMQGHIAKPLDIARLVRELRPYRPPARPAPAAPLLDLAAGLRQFGGQSALYRRTLQGFADQYAGGLAGWAGWLERGDWTELRRAAHTLQGLAATLGAQPLHHVALALEQAALATDAEAARRHLASVEGALAGLLDAVAATLAAAPPQPDAPAGTPGDLAELRQLLGHSDSRALDWWQAHGPQALLDAATRERIDAALAVLDFDAAAAALEAAG
jgi:CheY-like chemotaxis protein/signal transduction histidine kinase